MGPSEVPAMPKPTQRRPTDSELGILRVLWTRGPSTVREVQQELEKRDPSGSPTGYTTALKLLQIMTDKGLVLRDESERAHVYRAKVSEDQTQKRLIRDLVDRAFEGSPAKLVQQALSTRRATKEEIAEIKRMLEEMGEGQP